MSSIVQLARRIYRMLPDGMFRRRAAAWWFRRASGDRLKRCEWRDGCFTVETADGVTIHSAREFDPEPLMSNMPRLPLVPGAIMLDLGGNIGVTALYGAARVSGGGGGRVVVFEPDADNLIVLRKNVELNHARETVTVVSKGVSDRIGRMTFHTGGNYTSSFERTDYIEKDERAYRAVEVEVTTVDAECEALGLSRVDAVKMDIEGSEVAALRGARKTLEAHHPFMVIETHMVEGRSTADEVIEELRRDGYQVIERGDGPTPLIIAHM